MCCYILLFNNTIQTTTFHLQTVLDKPDTNYLSYLDRQDLSQ